MSERLFIVNSGRCRLEKRGVNVKMYNSGNYFGCTVMLGIHKSYIGTLIALQTCHIIAITATTFQSAMEQYPALAACRALMRAEKKAADALREAVGRTATRKLIYKRYHDIMVQDSDTDKSLVPGGFNN